MISSIDCAPDKNLHSENSMIAIDSNRIRKAKEMAGPFSGHSLQWILETEKGLLLPFPFFSTCLAKLPLQVKGDAGVKVQVGF
ncbi:hypothetical protein VNO78_01965 [Psophocarpus tetragonolobus]|uniref:Uncharacterized protein n=1 Tax=Psophocarpus tetragonolobus TaxID=3891 RepID=A0AAN9T0X7_PSOTE